MKRSLALPILLLSYCFSPAQRPMPKITLKGQVVDSATQAPVNATIVVNDSKNAVAMRSMASGIDGFFQVEVPADKSYVLHLSAVSYRAKDLAVAGVDRDLGKVRLVLSEAALQNAVVIASKKVIRQEIDRISTYQNVGSNRAAGVHLTLNYPLFTKLNLILNTQLSHVWLTGTYSAQYYRNDGTRGNAAASARYAFAHQLTATINFNYKSGDVFLQGKSSTYTYVGFNIIKDFLQRRATLSIMAFDPSSKFAQYPSTTKTPTSASLLPGGSMIAISGLPSTISLAG